MKKYLILSLSLSLFLLNGCSQPSDEQQVENARQFLEQGDVKAALIELKNSLQQNPENSQARVYLGQIYLKGSNFAAAEKELKRAIELGADPNQTHPYLARALLQLRKLDDVMALSGDALDDPEKGALIASQGLVHLIRGEKRKAAEFTERAVGLTGGSAYALVARASVYMRGEKSIDKARETLSRAFGADQDFAPAWSLLGDIEASQKNPEKALEAYDRALKLEPSNLFVRNKRVTINIMLKDLQKAQYDLDILKKRLPDNPAVYYSQGLIHLSKNNLEDAKSAFDLVLPAHDRYPLSLYYIALVNYLQGNLAQAEAQAEQFYTKNNKHLLGRKLLADIKYSQGEFATVIKLLESEVTGGHADEGVLNILAKTYLKMGKTEKGIALLEKVVERNPDSTEARTRLGVGLLAGGMDEKGFEQLKRAIEERNGDYTAEVYQVIGHLRNNNFDSAMKSAREFQLRAPSSEVPHNLLGMIYIATKDIKKAKESLQKSWEIKPGNVDAGINLASIALQEGVIEEAERYLHIVKDKHPDNLRAALKLAELNRREGKLDQFKLNLEETIRTHPDAVEPRLILARYFLNVGKPDQVTGLIEVLGLDARKLPEVLEVLIHRDLAQGRFIEADSKALQLLQQQPENPVAHYLLAEAKKGQGNIEVAKKQLDIAIDHNSRFLPARVAKLKLLVLEKKVDILEREITEIKSFAPDNQDVMKVEFALEQLKGDQIRALDLVKKLYELYPTLDNMQALARQYLRVGKNTEGYQLQIEWADKHKDDLRGNLLIAENFTRAGKPKTAIKYYQRALELAPNNVFALNNLAWSLRDSDPERALEHAQRANELKPGSVTLMDTLALAYLANNDLEMAMRTIKEVSYLEPKNPSIRYHEAMIRAASGEREDAAGILRELLSAETEFADKADAEALLKSLE